MFLIPIVSLHFAVHIGELSGLCNRIYECLVVQFFSAMVVRILFIFFFWLVFQAFEEAIPSRSC
jgi:hypothetical protein